MSHICQNIHLNLNGLTDKSLKYIFCKCILCMYTLWEVLYINLPPFISWVKIYSIYRKWYSKDGTAWIFFYIFFLTKQKKKSFIFNEIYEIYFIRWYLVKYIFIWDYNQYIFLRLLYWSDSLNCLKHQTYIAFEITFYHPKII